MAQHAADVIGGFEDRDLVALLGQMESRRQAAGSAAHDRHAGLKLVVDRPVFRFGVFRVITIHHKAFDRADMDRTVRVRS